MVRILVIASGGNPLNQHRFATGDILIDRYVVDRFLDAGGMQEVYVCNDRTLDRRVVVKTPKAGVRDRRFKRGAEMGARVNHPNVAATFDYYEDEALTFMVEEFVPGQNLGTRLKNEFFFMDPSLAAHVIHHVARALFEAHRVGICHRDLKPSNIMTSPDPGIAEIKLTDFGIAKLAEAELAFEIEQFGQDSSTLTSSQTLLGAVPYMAPECWQDWRSAGQPMDIWALGCVGYQLLTGEPPFGSGPPAIGAVIRAQQQGQVNLAQPPWFGQHVNTAQLERELWGIVMDCLATNPNARPDAATVTLRCDALCYEIATRRTGKIYNYGTAYGGKSQTGWIEDDASGDSWFFHRSEFFGANGPADWQHVNFSIYPGEPNPRSSPVLLIK